MGRKTWNYWLYYAIGRSRKDLIKYVQRLEMQSSTLSTTKIQFRFRPPTCSYATALSRALHTSCVLPGQIWLLTRATYMMVTSFVVSMLSSVQ